MTRVIPEMPSLAIASHVDPASGTVVLRWKAPDAPATLAYSLFRKPSGERLSGIGVRLGGHRDDDR